MVNTKNRRKSVVLDLNVWTYDFLVVNNDETIVVKVY